MKCPKCGHRFLKKSADDKVKLRTPILVFAEDGSAVAPCPKCKAEVPAPVTLEKSAVPEEPRLVLAPNRLTRSDSDP